MDDKDIKRYKKIRVLRMVFISLFILITYFLLSLLIIDNYKLNKTLHEMDGFIKTNSDRLSTLEEEPVPEAPYKEIIGEIGTNEVEKLMDAEEYPDKQRIYLTFDDGPGKYTNTLLDILNEYGVNVTFFVIYQPNHEEEYRRIVNEGNSLGIHSYTHAYKKVYKDVNGFTEDVFNMYDFLYETTGEEPVLYRFPGGSSNTLFKGDKNDLIDVLNDKNLVYYDWNVTSGDASNKTLTSNQIANNVIKGIGNKKEAIVLMHDTNTKKTTIDAIPIILDYYMDKDVVFLPITDSTETIQHVKKK